ncbi:hypothetical protein PN36_25760 [Candidatus Thiomargarita nelsonii]|uniref:Phytase-like domain-containing protein n=1 Tax=Candidatus Thiomargarita nelsonii TaxID=1003181 RepID=A0A4E0QYT8_9GAMM|nr:hypothetical protein PN36_25760 [Candidatus Thiomargarita nelsonii]
MFSEQHKIGDKHQEIRLRGTIELANHKINGLKLTELSGLAWDEDEAVLYAISDKGYLFHLRPSIKQNTLIALTPLSAYRLQTKLTKDSEGLAILNGDNGVAGDSELVISFEGKPQIARFTPKGKRLSDYTLPSVLQNIKNYYKPNKALEAVTVHPHLGIITAPEWPLKGAVDGQHKHKLYALDGKHWTFPAYPAPNSAIVALEALEDGSVLILERAFSSIFQPVIISLRQLWLSGNHRLIAVFDSSQGWEVDNFEGLTHHRGKYFFMVSDDNENSLQRTLLSYWELIT